MDYKKKYIKYKRKYIKLLNKSFKNKFKNLYKISRKNMIGGAPIGDISINELFDIIRKDDDLNKTFTDTQINLIDNFDNLSFYNKYIKKWRCGNILEDNFPCNYWNSTNSGNCMYCNGNYDVKYLISFIKKKEYGTICPNCGYDCKTPEEYEKHLYESGSSWKPGRYKYTEKQHCRSEGLFLGNILCTDLF